MTKNKPINGFNKNNKQRQTINHINNELFSVFNSIFDILRFVHELNIDFGRLAMINDDSQKYISNKTPSWNGHQAFVSYWIHCIGSKRLDNILIPKHDIFTYFFLCIVFIINCLERLVSDFSSIENEHERWRRWIQGH